MDDEAANGLLVPPEKAMLHRIEIDGTYKKETSWP
jgi:hypothetical protein